MVAKIDTAVPNMRLRTLAYLTKEKIAGTNVKNKLENASFAAQAPAAEKDTSLLTSVVAVYPMVAKIDTAVPNMRLRTSAYLTKEKIAGTNVKNKLENASFAAQAPPCRKGYLTSYFSGCSVSNGC